MGSRDYETVSAVDQEHLALLRDHVTLLFREASIAAAGVPNCRILDVAPQHQGGIKPHLSTDVSLMTLDIDPLSGADIVGDLCARNDAIQDASLDIVICTEVLEHVANPFAAVQEIHRMLKPGGQAYLSAPFNFRIHGPPPDNWRFTEHGWRQLMVAFGSVRIDALESSDRVLMPVHYNVVAVS